LEKTVKIIKKNKISWRLEADKRLVKEKETREIEVTNIVSELPNGSTKNEKHEKVLKTRVTNVAEIPLRKVTIKEIVELRNSGVPGFIFKKEDTLFYSQMDSKKRVLIQSLFTDVEIHKCADYCKHLSAACDEKGGCEKVRNKATFIERYDWIKLGCEVFNTNYDMLYVARCSHHESNYQKHKKISIEEKIKNRRALRDFFYS